VDGAEDSAGLGAVFQLLFDAGLIRILLTGIGMTIVADILSARCTSPSGKKPGT
jgi:hypothetical protein